VGAGNVRCSFSGPAVGRFDVFIQSDVPMQMVKMRHPGCLSIAVILAAIGCKGSTSAPTPSAPKAGTPGAAQVGELEDQLKSALYQLQPENLNIDSRLDDAVSVLNNWWAAIKEAGLKPQGLTLPELPRDRLTEPERERLERDSFGPEDGRAIHTAYFAKAIADHAMEDASSELARITKLFEWTCRNIALDVDPTPDRPATLYEILIMGHGSPADRAWVLGALLKQQRWDLVLLHPAGAKIVDPETAWLAGVVLDNDVVLFDLRIGLPVPNADKPGQPATLRQVLAHPEWLSALSPRADQPYEPNAEQLLTAEVEVFATPVSWSPRMWSVEQLLPGESLCVLYDPPGKLGDADGVFDRIAKAGEGWSADKLAVWGYPADRETQFATPDQRRQRLLDSEMVPFLMPVEERVSRETNTRSLVQTMQQLQIRTDQLYGRSIEAVSQYVTIRQLAVTAPPQQQPALASMYQRAADDAHYFSSVCKVESGDLDEAVRALTDYVKKSRRGGRWGAAARSLLADCLAAQGKLEQAMQTVRVQESDDPYRPRHAVLIRQWGAKAKPAEKTEPTPAQTPN
jgi:hypothetical protein